MKRGRFTEEQIIAVLRKAESGTAVKELCRRAGVSTVTFYKWMSKYAGMARGQNERPCGWLARYLLGTYLLSAEVKVLLPNAFIVHDQDLAGNCARLLEIVGIQRSRDDPTSPYGIGGGSFWLQIRAG